MTGRALRVLSLTVVLLLGTAACGGDKAVPYQDKESAGMIALYDANGQPRTSGNVNDKPFVSFAVSTEKAPAPYDRPGRKAALLAFQPRDGVDPGKWGGDFLTGSTSYPDANHPTASGTGEDISLANFIAEFPPQWDGLIQLRIYLGAPEQPGRTDRYATADIRVKDQTWTVVRGADNIPGGAPSATAPASGSPR